MASATDKEIFIKILNEDINPGKGCSNRAIYF